MSIIEKFDKKLKEGFIGQKMIVLPPNIKRTVIKNELIKRLYVTAIGYYPYAAFHDRERKFGCKQYILLHCVGGTGVVCINGKVFDLHPNHIIIIPRNTAHEYRASQEDPWTIYWMHFTGEHADLLYDRYSELKSHPVFAAFNEKIVEEFDLIFNLLDTGFSVRNLELANIKLQDYLSNLLYANEINPSMVERDKMSDSIDFMKDNIGKRLSLEHLARQQHLSITHYNRLFKAKTGASPTQYFNELKVQKSCQYLYFTDMSIKEICLELGFSDPYYFSRLFKKLTGIAPASYKNRRSEENKPGQHEI